MVLYGDDYDTVCVFLFHNKEVIIISNVRVVWIVNV